MRKKINKISTIVCLALLCSVVLELVGCKTIEPQTMVVYKTDTVKVYKRDSIYSHYRDTIREKQKGDTVYIEQIKWRIDYREFLRSDTVVKRDSIYQHDVVVQYKMNGFQKSFFLVGIVLSLLILLYICWKLFKKYYLHL